MPDLSIEWWDVEKPIDYPKNARKWSKGAIEAVGKSLLDYGFRQPLVVDAAGVICIGHLRRAAARWAKINPIPVHVARDLTPAQIRTLRIRDNRVHEESSWNIELLTAEMLELKSLDLDLGSTGFDPTEVATHLRDFVPVSLSEQGTLDKKKRIKCPECGHEFTP